MIPPTRAQELAALYDDHSDAAAPVRAIAATGCVYSDNHRANSLRYLTGRMAGSTVRECREIRALMDFATHAPLTRTPVETIGIIAR